MYFSSIHFKFAMNTLHNLYITSFSDLLWWIRKQVVATNYLFSRNQQCRLFSFNTIRVQLPLRVSLDEHTTTILCAPLFTNTIKHIVWKHSEACCQGHVVKPVTMCLVKWYVGYWFQLLWRWNQTLTTCALFRQICRTK